MDFIYVEHAGEGAFWQVVESTPPISKGAENSGEPFLTRTPHHVSMVDSLRLPPLIRQVESYTIPAAIRARDRREARPPDGDSITLRGRHHNPSPSQQTQQLYAPLPGSALNLSVNADNTSDELYIARDKGTKGKAREL